MQITTSWNRPEIAIDLDALRKEQIDRATWLDSRLTIKPGGLSPWTDVVAAMREIERRVGRSVLDGAP